MPTGLPLGAGEECGRMGKRELLSQRRDGARKGSQILHSGPLRPGLQHLPFF